MGKVCSAELCISFARRRHRQSGGCYSKDGFTGRKVNGYNGKEGLKEAAEMIQSLLRDYAGSDGGELIYFE